MTSKQPCTLEYLRNALSYDTSTGVFIWKYHAKRSDLIGRIAGSRQSQGYWSIAICNKKQLAHRLAWFYVTGKWPAQHIDHINGDKCDNRIVNLREVTRFENLQNMRKATKANKCGYLGVSAHQGKWRMQIMANGKQFRVSGFDTPEAAHEAYVAAKRKHHVKSTL